MPTVTEIILHCKRQLKKTLPDDKVLHYLRRLRRLHIKLQDLVDTGIGRTVNQLSRQEGEVGSFAEKLVSEWKALVEAESGGSSESSSPHKHSPDRKRKRGRRSSSDAAEDEKDEEDDDDNDQDQMIKHELEELQDELCDDDDEDVDDDEDGVGLVINESYNNNKEVHESDSSDKDEEEHSQMPTQKLTKKMIKEEPPSSSESEKSDDEESTHNHNHRNQFKGKWKTEQEETTDSDIDLEDKNDEPSSKNDVHTKSDRGTKSTSPDSHSSGKHKKKHELDANSNKTHDHVKIKKEKEDEFSTKKKDKHRHHHRKDKTEKTKSLSPVPDQNQLRQKKINNECQTDTDQEKQRKNCKQNGEKKEERKKVQLDKFSEIDSTSGINFEAVLGSLDTVNSSGTKSTKSSNSAKSTNSKSSSQSSTTDKEKIKIPKEENVRPGKQRVSHLHTNEKNENVAQSSRKSKLYDLASKSSLPEKLKVNDTPKASSSKSSSSTSWSQGSSSDQLKNDILRSLQCDTDNQNMLTESRSTSTVNRPAKTFVSRHYGHYTATEPDSTDGRGGDTLVDMIVSRKQKTKVYSGVKSGFFGTVPRLFDMCLRVIQENIDDLGFTGGVPYDILKPVLERATVAQLQQIEHYNPYLIESTGDLWAFNCKRDFRGEKRAELETWRELYSRCVEAREEKFEMARRRVGEHYDNKPAQRKVKLAYVETNNGPRFAKSKATTIQNGMKTLKYRDESNKGLKRPYSDTTASTSQSERANGQLKIEEAAVVIPARSRAATAPAGPSEPPNKKVKRAPLMQKTLKIIKSLSRR